MFNDLIILEQCRGNIKNKYKYKDSRLDMYVYPLISNLKLLILSYQIRTLPSLCTFTRRCKSARSHKLQYGAELQYSRNHNNHRVKFKNLQNDTRMRNKHRKCRWPVRRARFQRGRTWGTCCNRALTGKRTCGRGLTAPCISVKIKIKIIKKNALVFTTIERTDKVPHFFFSCYYVIYAKFQ